mgnify:CR=1 FL=1
MSISRLRNGRGGIEALSADDAYLYDGPVLFSTVGPLLDPRINFRRATPGWYLDAAGVLQQASIDVPRFARHSLGTTGLLLEGGQTNQALWSRDLTNAAWVKASVNAALNQTGVDNSPNSASSITASGAAGTVKQTLVDAVSGARTFSVFIKRLVGSGVIDLTLDNGTTWTPVTVTAGWTRVFVTQTLANPVFGIRINTSGDSVAIDFSQQERFGVMTSPILTTTTAVLRAEDIALIDGINFSEIYNLSAGSWYARWISDLVNISGVERNILSVDDNTANERFAHLHENGSATARMTVTDGGVNQAALLSGVPTNGAIHKMGVSYAVNDFRACLDGGAVGSDAAGSVPIVNQARLGGRFNSVTSHLYGHVLSVEYRRVISSNAELQAGTV